MVTDGIKNDAVAPASRVEELGMAAYRAPSLFQPHRAREALADAHAGRIRTLVGFFCGLASPPIAKWIAPMGFDIICIDWEHSAMNVETMNQMVHDVQFLSEGRTMAFVRLPNHGHAEIGYALDAGASILVPQVDTVEQAKHIASATKFGARVNGTRSAPPARFVQGVTDTPIDPSISLHQNLNRQAAVMIQIESITGINNLDAILTEVGEHIDSVWLGSLDCRISMGLGGFWGGEKEWLDAVMRYESVLAKHNKPASGLALGTTEQKLTLAKGRSLVFPSADMHALMGQMGTLAEVRELLPRRSYEGVYELLQ